MIRTVYGTNVAISGLLWSGTPRKAIQLAQQQRIHLLTSETMLDELRDVIARPQFATRRKFVGKAATQLVADYLQLAEVIEPASIEPVILSDPDDDAVLACAVGGNADIIVSGDTHLLDLGDYGSIAILSVNDFLDQVE